MKEITTRTNSVASRTLGLFDLLAANPAGLSVNEICKALDITKSTAYSLLRTCIETDHITRDPATGNFQIGYRFLEYLFAYQRRYPFYGSTARACINNALVNKLDFCTFALQGAKAALVFNLGVSEDTGAVPVAAPAWAFAPGRVLLVDLNEERLDEMLSGERRPLTDRTITDEKELREIIAQAGKQGYCVDHGEAEPGNVFIAAPVRDHSGRVNSCVAYQMTEEQFEESGERLIKELKESSVGISRDIGYDSRVFISRL